MTTFYHDAYQIYELLDKSYQIPPDPDAMRDLFIRRPSEAKRKFVYGQTLLHKCFDFFSHQTDVVDVLIEAYPESLKIEDDDGLLPIHHLLAGRWGENIVEMTSKLLGQYPESVVAATKSGELPLHIASKRTESVGVVKALLCFPDACMYRDNSGKFPLDHALDSRDPNHNIVQLLTEQHPVLLSFPDRNGALRIHKVLDRCSLLQKSSYDELIEILVSGCESSLRVQDGSGRTPLFIACVQNHSLSQIYSLVRKWPEQVTANVSKNIFSNNFNGEIMYPSLMSATKPRDVYKWLLQDPNARFRPDLFGRLPIHYAVVSSSDKAFEIVQKLLLEGEEVTEANESLCSRQLLAKDICGRTPIHIASASPSCSSDMLMMMINACPKALMEQDNDGRLPWHYGECSRQDVVFEQTATLYPEIEVNLDLVPEEIQWDILSVKDHDSAY